MYTLGLGYRAVAAGLLFVAGGCASRGVSVERLGPTELFERGMEAFQERNWQEAQRAFERVSLEYPTHPRIQEARFRLGEVYYRQKEYVTAATEFTRLATDYPVGPFADDARFKVCESYSQLSPRVERDQEYTEAAIEHCQSLIAYFPQSEFVPRARELMDELTNKLAEKIFVGRGEFYFKRQAYDAAILAYEQVLQTYPRTAIAPRALLRLVEVYEKLGYEEEAQAARQRLLREYPSSNEAKQVQGTPLARGS